MQELKPCPCGQTPTSLDVIIGDCSKWAYVSGNCCSEWNVEFRTEYNPVESEECKALAVEAWNRASRGTVPAEKVD